MVVGVDPHKKKHAAVTLTQDFTTQSKFKFDNTREGLEMMLNRARVEVVKSGCRGVYIRPRDVSRYWRNVAYFLDEHGIPYRFINQFTLKRRREGKDLNRRKNDFRDAQVAAELLCTGEFTETKLPQGVYAELRSSYSVYRRLVKKRTRIINLLKGLLDNLFPELTDVFKDPCGKTALTVLSNCPVPRIIAAMAEEQFVNSIRASHQGQRLARGKLHTLHHVAQTSVGVEAGADAAVGTMIAYYYREATGEGQHVDVSMQQSTAWFLADAIPFWELAGTITKRTGVFRLASSR